MDDKIKNWLLGCLLIGTRFARIQTYSAIYDRVAILPIVDGGDTLQIAYPRKFKKGWKITEEELSISLITSLIYYQD